VTPLPTWKTRLWFAPLMVTPAAGPVIVWSPTVSLSSSSLPPRVIVRVVVNAVGENSIVFAWSSPLASAIACASEPLPDELVFMTVNVESSRRSSSISRPGRRRCGSPRRARGAEPRRERENRLHQTIPKASRVMAVPFRSKQAKHAAPPGEPSSRGVHHKMMRSIRRRCPRRMRRQTAGMLATRQNRMRVVSNLLLPTARNLRRSNSFFLPRLRSFEELSRMARDAHASRLA
jgi:hypothetical protein